MFGLSETAKEDVKLKGRFGEILDAVGEKPHSEDRGVSGDKAGSGQVEERGCRSCDQKESGKVEEIGLNTRTVQSSFALIGH